MTYQCFKGMISEEGAGKSRIKKKIDKPFPVQPNKRLRINTIHLIIPDPQNPEKYNPIPNSKTRRNRILSLTLKPRETQSYPALPPKPGKMQSYS